MIVDKNKTYRTVDGEEVRIYATDHRGSHCVAGAICRNGHWSARTWRLDGKRNMSGTDFEDLVEIKSRIKRELWCNVYEDSWKYSDVEDYLFETKEEADESASKDRFACVKVIIDCEEGEGL